MLKHTVMGFGRCPVAVKGLRRCERGRRKRGRRRNGSGQRRRAKARER